MAQRGATEPVTSLGGRRGATAAGSGRRRGTELVHGLAELGEFRSRLGLRLLELVEAVAGLVELAHARASRCARGRPSARGYRRRSARWRLPARRCRARCRRRTCEARGRERAAERTGHRCQRHHRRHRGEAALAELPRPARIGPSRRARRRRRSLAGRHDHELAGRMRGGVALELQPWPPPWAPRPGGVSLRVPPGRARSRGIRRHDSGRGSRKRLARTSGEFGSRHGPAPREPVSRCSASLLFAHVQISSKG